MQLDKNSFKNFYGATLYCIILKLEHEESFQFPFSASSITSTSGCFDSTTNICVQGLLLVGNTCKPFLVFSVTWLTCSVFLLLKATISASNSYGQS